ncbi:MAG: chromate efflux transporter [Catalinimonas sp.]
MIKPTLRTPRTLVPEMSHRRIRHYIFLRDVLLLAVTAFGGPQAHVALYIELLVVKRRYLTEGELMELYALCQMLPGPTSTQTLTAVGFRVGGPRLAYLTLLTWLLPASILMTAAAIGLSYLQLRSSSLAFTRFIQPIAVAFVAVAAWRIASRVVHTPTGGLLMLVAAGLAYLIPSPWVFPVVLIASGTITAVRYRHRLDVEEKVPVRVEWSNFFVWVAVFVAAAVLGAVTGAWPVRLFENFYRNGSLIFGGGQVLIPLMYTEFVTFKQYLTSEEFLSGFALVQALPGPVFSFCAYIGALTGRLTGSVWGQVLGSVVALGGVFLPGTFLIFFVIRFWEQLKRYRVVRASLDGIQAASSGLVIAAAFLLFKPLEPDALNVGIIVVTAILLLFTRVPSPAIIAVGLLAGFVF